MKKILSMFVFVILCSSMIFADNGNQNVDNTENEIKQQSKVVGLENAMIRVRIQERAQHIEQVMEKIQTQRREMLNGLVDLEITEDEDENICAIGKAEGKLFWGLIPIQRRLKYDIDSEGNVKRVRTWHELLWKKDNTIEWGEKW